MSADLKPLLIAMTIINGVYTFLLCSGISLILHKLEDKTK